MIMRLIENNELRIFENSIMFSFLPISDSNFSFDVYRRSADGVKAEQESVSMLSKEHMAK